MTTRWWRRKRSNGRLTRCYFEGALALEACAPRHLPTLTFDSEYVLGRSEESRIFDITISRRHVKLERTKDDEVRITALKLCYVRSSPTSTEFRTIYPGNHTTIGLNGRLSLHPEHTTCYTLQRSFPSTTPTSPLRLDVVPAIDPRAPLRDPLVQALGVDLALRVRSMEDLPEKVVQQQAMRLHARWVRGQDVDEAWRQVARFQRHLVGGDLAATPDLLLPLDLRGHRCIRWNPTHLNSAMRIILLEWLSEVCRMRAHENVVLHRAMHIADTFLGYPANRDLPRTQYQLVGACAFMLATKCEGAAIEYRASDIVWLCDGAYTHQQVLSQELTLLLHYGESCRNSTVHSWYVHALSSSSEGDGLDERGEHSLVLDLSLRSVEVLLLPCRLVAEQLFQRTGDAWNYVRDEHARQKLKPQGEVARKYGDVLLESTELFA